ncbi:MAG TPA: hypothetical protein VGL63_17760 [Streptosporangiaceae bacterium]|jgi:FtsZ-interacting cell division protein ZipA
MSTGLLIVIVVVVIVIVALAAVGMAAARRRRLQKRFGPEYERVVGERQSQRKAEAELASRERRVKGLNIRPLSTSARDGYAARWTAVQERFVDQPRDAVAEAQILVTEVMNERGYPTEEHDQMLADLSVKHASTLEHYRSAHEISQNAEAGNVSTEELRQAMVRYRVLFSDLLGEPDDQNADGAQATGASPATGSSSADADRVPSEDLRSEGPAEPAPQGRRN